MIVNFEHAFTQWASVAFGGGAAAGAGKGPVCFTTFNIGTINLPRQARDKHAAETLKKREGCVFCCRV